MSLQLKIDITQDLETGMSIRIDDITGNYTAANPGGYGSPNILENSVTATRFLFSSVLTEQQAENVTECIPSVQYEVTGIGSGIVVIGGQEYVLGDKFILEEDATPTIPSGLFVTQTGVYATLTNFLPTDEFVEFPSALIGVNDLIFPDSAYQVTYEEYTTPYLAGASFPAGTYIVVQVNSNTNGPPNVIQLTSTGFQYRPGEVFTVTGSDTFTDIIQISSVNLLSATITEDFPLFYNVWALYKTIEQEYAIDACCNKTCLENKLERMAILFDAIVINYQDNLDLDNSGTQGILEEIINIGNQQCI